MYYLVTIGYETEQVDRDGNARLQKSKYIFEPESVEETTILPQNTVKEMKRASQILGITHMPIECVVSPKTSRVLQIQVIIKNKNYVNDTTIRGQ